jgi:hypothetical protein
VSDNGKFAKRFHSTACSTVKRKRNQLALLPHDEVTKRKVEECSYCKKNGGFCEEEQQILSLIS